MAYGQPVSITIPVRVIEGFTGLTISNTANATPADNNTVCQGTNPNQCSSKAEVTLPPPGRAAITIMKMASNLTPNPNQEFTGMVTVHNSSQQKATARVRDVLPAVADSNSN